MRRSIRAGVALALALAIHAVGCGGSDKKTSSRWQPPEDDDIPSGGAGGAEGAGRSSGGAARGPAEVNAYTASEAGFLVSSYAVVDSGQILVVDAQLIRPDAQKLIAMVKGLGGKVKTIFITHPHPDHYMGLEWLTAAFPAAKVVAAPDTAEAIARNGDATLRMMKSRKFMGGALADLLPSRVIVPKPYEEDDEEDTIAIGRTQLRVLTFQNAESAVAHALLDQKSGALFAGDLVYNQVHLWLKETPPGPWIDALEELKQLEPQRVYPGHGEPTGPEVLDADIKYLRAFEAAIDSSTTQKELVDRVVHKYPDWRLPIIVQIAAPTYRKR